MDNYKTNCCFFLSMVIILLFNACSFSEKESEFIKINIVESFHTRANTQHTSELFNTVRYIPLETTEDALLHGINKVIFHDNYIFVSDNRSVYQFDREGRFIRKIGSVGSGPGEFIGMIRFSVDPVHEEILIISTMTHVLNAYCIDGGHFLYKKDLPFITSDLAHLKDGNCVFFTREFNKRFDRFTVAEAFLLNRDRQIIDSVTNNLRNDIQNNSMGYVNVFPDAGELSYIYNYRDTLYHIDHNFDRKPLARFIFDNKEDSNVFDIFPAPGQIQYPGFLWISNLLGNSKYFFITVKNGFAGEGVDNSAFMIYNKNERVLSRVESLENDLDNDIPLWPRWVQNDKLISFLYAHEILSFFSKGIESNKYKEGLWQIADTLHENDNPVLVIME